MSTDNNPYAPPTAVVADVHTHAAGAVPALWNPNVAASWSLIFSPMFGALVHMKNWQALGEPEKAANAKLWAFASLAYLVFMTVLAIGLPQSKGLEAISRIGGFVLLLAWYYGSGKAQNTLVVARYGRDYPRKSWLKPLGLALAAVVGFMVVIFIVGIISAAITPSR